MSDSSETTNSDQYRDKKPPRRRSTSVGALHFELPADFDRLSIVSENRYAILSTDGSITNTTTSAPAQPPSRPVPEPKSDLNHGRDYYPGAMPRHRNHIEVSGDDLAQINASLAGFTTQLADLKQRSVRVSKQNMADYEAYQSQQLSTLGQLEHAVESAQGHLQDQMMLHGTLLQYQRAEQKLDEIKKLRDDSVAQFKELQEEEINLTISLDHPYDRDYNDDMYNLRNKKDLLGLKIGEYKRQFLAQQNALIPIAIAGLAVDAPVSDKIAHQQTIVNNHISTLHGKVASLQKGIEAFPTFQDERAEINLTRSQQPVIQQQLAKLCKIAYNAKDYAAVLDFIHDFAPRNNPDAFFYQGLLHYEGRFSQLHPPIQDSDLDAQPQQGQTQAQPTNPPDYRAAHDSWLQAATLGHSDSQFRLGLLLAQGKLGTQVSTSLHRFACPFGLLSRGQVGMPELLTARTWWTKAAEQGHTDAQCCLGIFCQEGLVEVYSGKAALKWYTQAAKQGNAIAQMLTGRLYYSGKATGTEDHYTAREWWMKAAALGNAEAQFHLGFLCLLDYGDPPRDPHLACEWFTKAAQGGDIDAQYQLGYFYQNDTFGAPNYLLAHHWLLKAAEQGDAHAQFDLADLYQGNNLGAPDLQQAFVWYTKAAEQGHSPSIEQLQDPIFDAVRAQL